MSIRYRPLRPADIGRCVEHLGKHPAIGPRYGKAIGDLPVAISRTFREDYPVVTLFEEIQDSSTQLLGVGMAVFVSDEFLLEAKQTPFFSIGPELARRVIGGRSPLLSKSQLRDANTRGGLNLVVWHSSCFRNEPLRVKVGAALMTAFQDFCRGFQLKEIYGQADSLSQLPGVRAAGGFYFDPIKRAYGSFPELDATNFSAEPRNYGITRASAASAAGSWIGSLFVYNPPVFGFSRSEQRILVSALSQGETEEELSKSLGISLFAVKKTWRAIYGRVAASMPELFPGTSQPHLPTESRGKQKKQRLLAYVREHPEELRPVSQQFLHSPTHQRDHVR